MSKHEFLYHSCEPYVGIRHGPARVAYWGCPEEPLGAERHLGGEGGIRPIPNN